MGADCRNGYTLHIHIAVDGKEYPCTFILLAADMDKPCTSILLVVVRDMPSTSILLAVEMQKGYHTQCTSKLQVVESD
jgi:hypothetical protein